MVDAAVGDEVVIIGEQAAFYLKNTNFQINHIAELCGFSDPYYFSRTFHKLTGQSPKQYRDTP